MFYPLAVLAGNPDGFGPLEQPAVAADEGASSRNFERHWAWYSNADCIEPKINKLSDQGPGGCASSHKVISCSSSTMTVEKFSSDDCSGEADQTIVIGINDHPLACAEDSVIPGLYNKHFCEMQDDEASTTTTVRPLIEDGVVSSAPSAAAATTALAGLLLLGQL